MITPEVLSEMVKRIVQEADPEQVILFGSYARDQATADSDLDFLVVEREPFTPNRSRRKAISRIRRALSSFPVTKDILVYSTDEMRKWQNSINHIAAKSLREGRILYERR